MSVNNALFEDKVMERAVTMVLGAVYEQDFLPTSYGYRPEIGALHALRDLREELMAMGGGLDSGGGHPFILRQDGP